MTLAIAETLQTIDYTTVMLERITKNILVCHMVSSVVKIVSIDYRIKNGQSSHLQVPVPRYTLLNAMFKELKLFKAQHGHANVPRT